MKSVSFGSRFFCSQNIIYFYKKTKLITYLYIYVFELPTLLIFLFLVLIRPVSIFIHELGHAFSALIFSTKKVNVFLGSFGHEKNSLKIPIYRVNFFFYKNPFKWGYDLCSTEEKNISINNQIYFAVAGPITSLLTALISYFIITKTDFWTIFFSFLLFSSALDFILNIFPSNKAIQLADGRTTVNDGKTIINLFKLKRLPKEYSEGITYFNDKRFDRASDIFDKLLLKNSHPNIFRMSIASNLNNKTFEKAKEISKEFSKSNKMNSDDFTNYALSYTETGFLAESLEFYDASLKLNPKNKFSLNNKGYTFLLLGNYSEALPLFDRAIDVDSNFSYSYNNRGLAKIKLNLLNEGLKDVETALKLDSENPHVYKNLGIYYFENKDYNKALELFLKSKKMDSKTHDIDILINQTNILLAS